MEAYDLPRSVRPIQEFIDEFSTWWLRRSRDRFKGPASAKANSGRDDQKNKEQALVVFKHTLMELSKVMAPFTPFIADYLYKQIGGELESVHLEKWPETFDNLINQKVLDQMEQARKIVEMGLAERAEKGIKIRQPLGNFQFSIFNFQNDADQYLQIIADELNVKKVEYKKDLGKEIELDMEITEELQIEGMLRELIRTINDMRKKQGLTPGDVVEVLWQSDGEIINKVFGNKNLVAELQKSTVTQNLSQATIDEKEIKINNESIKLKVKKL
jgi:isoleucyl-tRNA synthetase